MVEEWCRDARKMADAEAISRTEVKKTLGAFKQEQHELVEKFKEVETGRRSTEAGLKNVEKQVEDQRQLLHVTETNLAIEKQAVLNLKTALQKAKEEVQLAKEAAEAEKRAAYQLGVEEMKTRLTEELSEVCRDYCSITWGQALNAAGVPVDSAWRLPENVFYLLEIRKVPADAPEASEQLTVVLDAIPIAEITKCSSQVTVQSEDAEGEKGKGKGRGKKPSSKSKDPSKETVTEAEGHGVDPKAKDVPPLQPEQNEDPSAEV